MKTGVGKVRLTGEMVSTPFITKHSNNGSREIFKNSAKILKHSSK